MGEGKDDAREFVRWTGLIKFSLCVRAELELRELCARGSFNLHSFPPGERRSPAFHFWTSGAITGKLVG